MDLPSKTIRVRLIEEADATFVLGLRLDERYNRHLSGGTGTIGDSCPT